METTESKQQLIDRVRRERAAWEGLLAEIGEERMARPGAMGDWSFKDLIAHLTGWQRHELRVVEAARRGEAPGAPAWPADLETDEINQWIYDRNRDRPLSEVLADSRASWQQLEEGLQALPEAALTEPGRYPWMQGKALGPQAIHDFTSHFPNEHEPAVRDWLARTERT